MRVEGLSVRDFRGFSDLTINGIPREARLVVLAGPNGSGKSAVFDAFSVHQGTGHYWDGNYHAKQGPDWQPNFNPGRIAVRFHDGEHSHIPFYIRTPYRNQSELNAPGLAATSPLQTDQPRKKLSQPDAMVHSNYSDLTYNVRRRVLGGNRNETAQDVIDEQLAQVRLAISNVFEGRISLAEVGDFENEGTFFFAKPGVPRLHFNNLSAGELAAFDLLLDVSLRRSLHPGGVFCIDEPELHLDSKVQGRLLNELLRLIPDEGQLWIATHSLGFIREAVRRNETQHDVAFLDFSQADFAHQTRLTPVKPSRQFWRGALRVAIADIEQLVAPEIIVLVEGRPSWDGGSSGNVEFDAQCLRNIFSTSKPEVEFISVGSADDVTRDTYRLVASTPVISPGTNVIRVVDRDGRSDDEVARLRKEGIQTLGERDLENYLLDDEILSKYCKSLQCSDKVSSVLTRKKQLLKQVVESGKPSDDLKAISGQLYDYLRRELDLRSVGNSSSAFLRDTLSKLITADTRCYQALHDSIFGH
jgi:predicted ATPase